MKNIYLYDSIIGRVVIEEENESITRLIFIDEKSSYEKLNESITIKKAYIELTEYLEGKRKEFTIKLNPKGTSFQKIVWESLMKIPYGKTKSYQDIAELIGNKKAVRAVGLANNRNPIPIFIPCHRVIAKTGKLHGYSGGLDIKKKLLDIEKNNIK